MSNIDFQGLAQALIHRSRTLLPEWLPGGKLIGNEYTCANIHGGDGTSMKVNVNSGKWADFSANLKGGDLISLYAAINNIKNGEAAKRLDAQLGVGTIKTDQVKAQIKPKRSTLGVPPAGELTPNFTDYKTRLKPTLIHEYKTMNGGTICYTARYDLDNGKKEVKPFSWDTEKRKWLSKRFPSPTPLYGLDRLEGKDLVLVVEGEKCADYASKIMKKYACVTWMGGTNSVKQADWSPLYGKKIVLWPDRDNEMLADGSGPLPRAEQPGYKAMMDVARQLQDHCPEIKLIDIYMIDGLPHGWDIVDAGFKTHEEVVAFVKPLVKIIKLTEDIPPPEENPQRNEEMPDFSDVPPPEDEPIKYDRNGLPIKEGGFYKYHKGKALPQYKEMAMEIRKLETMVFDSKGHYKYKDGVWIPFNDDYLRNMICESNIKHIQPAHIDNFAKIIKSFSYVGAFDYAESGNKLNLNNGVLDLDTYELTPHDKKHFFKSKIPANYDPKAEYPMWTKFLEEVFEGDQTMVDTSQLIFGYILMGGYPFLHRAFVLPGDGRNGKSVYLDVLRAVIGEENTASVSLANIDKPFSAVMLDGKIANILEETPTDKINAEIFKAAVGGGSVQMSRKFMDEYAGKVNARFIFACNKLPVFGDNSTGNLDRLFFIPFNRYFAPHERDTTLAKKIITKEISGVLSWSIEGIKKIRAMEHPDIEEPVKSLAVKEQYQIETDSVYNWVDENLEIGPDAGQQSTSELYENYAEFTKNSGIKCVSKNNFSRLLNKHGSRIARRIGINNFESEKYYVTTHFGQKQIRGFKNCRLR